MRLLYENRDEMQRSLRRYNIREVFVCSREGKVRVTALLDSRSYARIDLEENTTAEAETVLWKDAHFDVLGGEVGY